MAENGPPQYDCHPASNMSNVKVGNNAYLICVLFEDDEPMDYEPGHVLALEILEFQFVQIFVFMMKE